MQTRATLRPRLNRNETRLKELVRSEAEKASLKRMVDDQRQVFERGNIGRASSGKTRLDIEVCELAVSRGWQADFLDSGDRASLRRAQRTD